MFLPCTIQNIKKNKPTEKIFKEANEEGYVVAPSQTSNPTKMQQRAESAVGQTKMIEAINIKNQEVTDRLVRKYLGLKEDAPLDALIMDQVRKSKNFLRNFLSRQQKILLKFDHSNLIDGNSEEEKTGDEALDHDEVIAKNLSSPNGLVVIFTIAKLLKILKVMISIQ